MLNKFNILPRWLIFFIDILVCSASLVFAYIIRNNLNIQVTLEMDLKDKLVTLAIVNSIVFFSFRTYSGIIRYAGIQDVLKLFLSLIVSTLGLAIINKSYLYFTNVPLFSNLTLIIYNIISFPSLISYRFLAKYSISYLRNYSMSKKVVLIYGAGEAGFVTKQVLEHDNSANIHIAAFLDDDPRKKGKLVDGIKIKSPTELPIILKNILVDELIIASFSLSIAKKNQIVDICLDHKIKIMSVPPLNKWINGIFSPIQLKKIEIESLLERDTIKINNDELGFQLFNKRILVSGAAGSIGSELVRQLLKFNPQIIILCDQAESPLHHLELELKEYISDTKCITFLGDIRNHERMKELFDHFKPQYVYHAAAYKHVPILEYCPQEAIFSNVYGTKIIADLAVEYQVEKFVMISTDKAVNPTNVMGASKRLAEMYVQVLQKRIQQNQNPSEELSNEVAIKFITTRFGNVLGSNGSVINRFKEQIEKGGPVTVTHPDITRYFMTIPEACQLVLEAGSMGEGGEIFVFDMGKPIAIKDLAKKMIRLYGYIPDNDISIKFSGLRPGEKLFEELLMNSENSIPTYHEKILIARVKDIILDEITGEFDYLFKLSREQISTFELVKQMKKMVPEFLSNNSVFEALDHRGHESNVVPISRIS